MGKFFYDDINGVVHSRPLITGLPNSLRITMPLSPYPLPKSCLTSPLSTLFYPQTSLPPSTHPNHPNHPNHVLLHPTPPPKTRHRRRGRLSCRWRFLPLPLCHFPRIHFQLIPLPLLEPSVLLVTPLLKFDHELSTPGTRNIQDRFSAGGAAKTHTPALGTKRGDSEDVLPRGKAGLDRGGKEWNEKVEQQAPRT